MATSWAAVREAERVDAELGAVQRTADPTQVASDAGREPTPSEHEDAERRTGRISDLHTQLDGARSTLARAVTHLSEAGQTAANAMHGSWKDGLHDSGWYKFLHGLIKFFTVIGMILGVLAFFIPGLGIAAIVGAIAAAFTVVAAALKFTTGEGNILELVLGLTGLVTLGLGSKISALTKGALTRGMSSAKDAIRTSAAESSHAARSRVFDDVLQGKTTPSDAMEALGRAPADFGKTVQSELRSFDDQFGAVGPDWWKAVLPSRGTPWFGTWREAGAGDWSLAKQQWQSVRGTGDGAVSAWWGRFTETADLTKRNELNAWLGQRGLDGIGAARKWHVGGSAFGAVWGKGTFVGTNIGLGNDFHTPTPNPDWVAAHKGAFPDVHAHV